MLSEENHRGRAWSSAKALRLAPMNSDSRLTRSSQKNKCDSPKRVYFLKTQRRGTAIVTKNCSVRSVRSDDLEYSEVENELPLRPRCYCVDGHLAPFRIPGVRNRKRRLGLAGRRRIGCHGECSSSRRADLVLLVHDVLLRQRSRRFPRSRSTDL